MGSNSSLVEDSNSSTLEVSSNSSMEVTSNSLWQLSLSNRTRWEAPPSTLNRKSTMTQEKAKKTPETLDCRNSISRLAPASKETSSHLTVRAASKTYSITVTVLRVAAWEAVVRASVVPSSTTWSPANSNLLAKTVMSSCKHVTSLRFL